MAAYALCEDGPAVLLRLGLGPRESTEACMAFLCDLDGTRPDGASADVLDGSPGPIKAVRQIFPGVRRQRCQVHKMRNIWARPPRLAQRELKPLIRQVFWAPDHRTALKRGRMLIARFRARFPSAMECLEKDMEECLAYLLFPVQYHKRIRTTNLLERTSGESRRRSKVIPGFPGEHACLSLIFATLITASKRWQEIATTPKILHALDALRAERAATREQAVA